MARTPHAGIVIRLGAALVMTLFFEFSVSLAGADEASPQVHPVERYAPIWTSGWFAVPRDLMAHSLPQVDEKPFPYKLVGIGTLDGKSLTYFADEKGRVIEAAPGQPLEDFTVLRIEQGGLESTETTVFVRHLGRVVSLTLAGPSVGSAPDAGLTSMDELAPDPRYANYPHLQRSVKTTYGVARHRIPGTTPVPPPRPPADAK